MGNSSEEDEADAAKGTDGALVNQTLSEFMARSGMRHTEQRRLIVQTLLTTPGHFTVDELLAKVRDQNPAVGYATVYRALKLLVESGVASERHFGEGSTRYEVTLLGGHHDHLICEECGLIIEFDEPIIEDLQLRVALSMAFELTGHRHELYGVCLDTIACERRKLTRTRRP